MRKVKIKVPSSLNDIRLSQYQKFLRVIDGLEDEKLINKRMVAVFCNLTDTIVNNMTKQSFDETLLHLVKILDFDKDMPLIRMFKHQGQNMGFIPNMDEMTVGELADVDNFIADWQKMHQAMEVLYRPLKTRNNDKYTIEDYNPTGEGIDPPLDVALSAYFFLNNLLKDLLTYIPNSIKSIVQQDQKLKTLVENGDGINQSMESLKAICLDLKMSIN